MVDAGLAADRRVDLGQQGGRHLDEVDAALIARRSEAGHVADNATTEGHHRGAAVVPGREEAVENQLQGFPVFVGFAIREDHWQHRIGTQRLAETFEIQGRDGLVGNDGNLPAGNVRRQQFWLLKQAFANVDRVAALAQVDL
ncbi:hypothetical protein D3C78_1165140 [compost metagenome]